MKTGADRAFAATSISVKLLSAALVMAVSLLTACSGGGGSSGDSGPVASQDQVFLPDRGYYLGVLPTPGNAGTTEEAYELAGVFGEWTPEWGRPSDFWEFADDINGVWGSTYLESYCRGNGMFPLIQISFMASDSELKAPAYMTNPTLSDPAWRELFTNSVVDIVRAAQPLYISIGNEVNRWYESQGDIAGDPNAFRNWVSLYEETYDAIKVASPDTQVFCVFAREKVTDHTEADLISALQYFPPGKLDAVMLTSYPYSVAGVNTVTDIPDDYYSAAIPTTLLGKPFGFTEVAWTDDAAYGGEAGQVDFLTAVTGRLTSIQGLNLDFLGWPWLHDLNANDTIGLIRFNGMEKLAFWKWKALSQNLSREDSLPAGAVKMTAATDNFLPVLHSATWNAPVPLTGPFNTAGVEDSPFVTPDGNDLYFFFTPDALAPPENQLLDGVSGTWWSRKISGTWSEPVRINLFEGQHLDGAHCVSGDTLWLGSIRSGNYGVVDYYLATYANHVWGDPVNAGVLLNGTYDIGECHLAANGALLYFGTTMGGGFGSYDLWTCTRYGQSWLAPVNLGGTVNSWAGEYQPFVTPDGIELWFTRESGLGYTGPSVWRSQWNGNAWGTPAEIVSNFCGEPTLDSDGNLYFVHMFMTGTSPLLKIEADIYVAIKAAP